MRLQVQFTSRNLNTWLQWIRKKHTSVLFDTTT